MVAKQVRPMYEIQADSLAAELQGWQVGFETGVLMPEAPDTRENPAAAQQRAIQRYREMWRGEHEISSETHWLAGWLRGYNVGRWLMTTAEAAYGLASAAVRQVEEVKGTLERERATPKPKRPRRPKDSNS